MTTSWSRRRPAAFSFFASFCAGAIGKDAPLAHSAPNNQPHADQRTLQAIADWQAGRTDKIVVNFSNLPRATWDTEAAKLSAIR